jgi:hypothetical protein
VAREHDRCVGPARTHERNLAGMGIGSVGFAERLVIVVPQQHCAEPECRGVHGRSRPDNELRHRLEREQKLLIARHRLLSRIERSNAVERQ